VDVARRSRTHKGHSSERWGVKEKIAGKREVPRKGATARRKEGHGVSYLLRVERKRLGGNGEEKRGKINALSVESRHRGRNKS